MEPVDLGPFPVSLYAAMLAATIAGQFLGIGIEALVHAGHAVWVPLACSVVLEAAVGARLGARLLGHRLARDELVRLSAYYSIVLGAVSLPLAGWLYATRAGRAAVFAPSQRAVHDVAQAVAISLAVLALVTIVRFLLMRLFAGRGP